MGVGGARQPIGEPNQRPLGALGRVAEEYHPVVAHLDKAARHFKAQLITR